MILIMDSDNETAVLEAVLILCMILPVKAVISLRTFNSLVFIPDRESVRLETETACCVKIG
jgi:hypothetical protein